MACDDDGMDVAAQLDRYEPATAVERTDLDAARALFAEPDAFDRFRARHVTGSALVVHPPSGRILLRWHERLGGWFQVGGHGDPGEHDPFVVAQREAAEETGLVDLAPWPGPDPCIEHLVVVPVPAAKGEPAHEHLDVRYLLATAHPDAVRAEHEEAELAWVSPAEALTLIGEENLAVLVRRVVGRLAAAPPAGA